MNLGLKEMRKNKARYLILGSIVLLVSLLTFIISGLANGLSYDNAAMVKNLPDGHFYLDEDAEESYNLSKIDSQVQKEVMEMEKDAAALSIQMGFLNDHADNQYSVAFVASTNSEMFENVGTGEVILDSSLIEKGIKKGDRLTSDLYDGELIVKGFAEGKKFSHAPVAFIPVEAFQEMYRTETMQMLFIPGEGETMNADTLESFTKDEFLNTIPSYKAEQLSLNMIVVFLIVISGMLFAIFFYMMNVQKLGLYGILKAIGVKTSTLFRMMWTQMIVITAVSLGISITISVLFSKAAPEGLPFHLPANSIFQLAIVFVVISFIGSTLSGLQIKKVGPLQAIQQGEV
ncbi:ABC transporter permease [Bacillus sp. EB01]|uniref:ABC transporter permease n=1 Tax=Bacillus sp. EB01 TaxID=1347086 RepID=UPI0005C4BD2F|nr:ABC transporter permease [Bacillus sp. EB01]